MTNLSKIVLVMLALALMPAMAHAQCLDSTDVDNDGVIACEDNCPEVYNPQQEDFDGDEIGRACDPYDGCCGVYTRGYPGNIDFSEDGKRSLADIARHIDHVYIDRIPLECFENGDLNFDGVINLADITIMIDHVYIAKQEFDPCGS